MYFADTLTDALSNSGLPGVSILIIVGLVTALIYFVRQNDSKQKKIDELQETRIQELKEVNDRLAGPMKEQTELSNKIYDVLLSSKRGR